MCSFYGTESERLHHIFIDCKFAKSSWQEIDYNISVPGDQDLTVWLPNAMSSDRREEIIKIIMDLWGIWFFRNKLV